MSNSNSDGARLADEPEKIPGGTGRWIDCPNCRGEGEIVNCIDDLCHAAGLCMHDGNDMCFECDGSGRVWMWFSETLERHPELKEADGVATDGGVDRLGDEEQQSEQQTVNRELIK